MKIAFWIIFALNVLWGLLMAYSALGGSAAYVLFAALNLGTAAAMWGARP